jgi:FeS assembly SUF system protein
MSEAKTNDLFALPVLPHSNKVEQLRQQVKKMNDDPTTTPPSPSSSPGNAAPATQASAEPAAQSMERKLLEGRIIAALRTVYDPEIPVNIYDLGLIYKVDISDDNSVKIDMTLTAPACPVAGTLPGEVATKIRAVEGVNDAEVELVWEPAWSKSRISEDALLELGLL